MNAPTIHDGPSPIVVLRHPNGRTPGPARGGLRRTIRTMRIGQWFEASNGNRTKFYYAATLEGMRIKTAKTAEGKLIVERVK